MYMSILNLHFYSLLYYHLYNIVRQQFILADKYSIFANIRIVSEYLNKKTPLRKKRCFQIFSLYTSFSIQFFSRRESVSKVITPSAAALL